MDEYYLRGAFHDIDPFRTDIVCVCKEGMSNFIKSKEGGESNILTCIAGCIFNQELIQMPKQKNGNP